MVMEQAQPQPRVPRDARHVRSPARRRSNSRSPPPISKPLPSISRSPPRRRGRARSRTPPRRTGPRDDESMDSRSFSSSYSSSSSRSRSPPRRRDPRGVSPPPPRRRRRDPSLSSRSYSSYSSRSRSPPRRRSSRSRGRPRSASPTTWERRPYGERYSPPRRYRPPSLPPRRRRRGPEFERREPRRGRDEVMRDRRSIMDDNARDLRTVFISQLAQKVREPDVYEFFSRAGRVRDVRLIMDRMSSKHKSAGYVEFFGEASVLKAIAFDGTMLCGFPVAVKPCVEQNGAIASVRGSEGAAMRGLPHMPAGVRTESGAGPVKAFDDSVVGWSNKYRARKVELESAADEIRAVAHPPGHDATPVPPVSPAARKHQLVSIEELKKLLNPLGLPIPPLPLTSSPGSSLVRLEGPLQSLEQVPLPTVGSGSAPVQPAVASGAVVSSGFTRLYVGSVSFQLTEADLRAIFEPFGSIASLQLQRDATGKSRGYGFVEFAAHESAKKALEINGLAVAGRTLKVALASQENRAAASSAVPDVGATGVVPLPGPTGQVGGMASLPGADVAGELDEGRDGGLAINASQRVALMQQLSRGESIGKTGDDIGKLAVSTVGSRSLMLANMFDPAAEPKGFELELAEDVRDECISKYGPVVHLHVEARSQGIVYVRFQANEDAERARNSLNGRWFGGKQIQAGFVSDKDYLDKFPTVGDK